MRALPTTFPRTGTASAALLVLLLVAGGCSTSREFSARESAADDQSPVRKLASNGRLDAKPERVVVETLGQERELRMGGRIPNVIGTAFVVHRDGFAITCSHVLQREGVLVAGRNGERFDVEEIAHDDIHDLALIRIVAPMPLESVAFETHSEAFPGQQVYTVGFPISPILGLSPKLSEGIINSRRGLRDKPTEYQTSVTIQPGNSGGALFDETGSVVGMISSRLDDIAVLNYSGTIPQNVNYALKSHVLVDFLWKHGVPVDSSTLTINSRPVDFQRTVARIEASSFYLFDSSDL